MPATMRPGCWSILLTSFQTSSSSRFGLDEGRSAALQLVGGHPEAAVVTARRIDLLDVPLPVLVLIIAGDRPSAEVQLALGAFDQVLEEVEGLGVALGLAHPLPLARACVLSQVFSSTSGGNGTPIQVSLGFLVPCVPYSVVTQLVLPYQ